MVNREEIEEYYAEKHGNAHIVPAIVKSAISGLGEDEIGFYPLSDDLFVGERHYMTFDEVREVIRANIRAEINTLIKISWY